MKRYNELQEKRKKAKKIIVIIIIIIFLKNRHKLRLVKKEDRKKYTDMLTSLKNRNYLNKNFKSWIQQGLWILY